MYCFQLSRKITHLVRTYYFLCRLGLLRRALSQGEVTSILMTYFACTKRIDFPFVSKENHFEGTHHDVMNGTIKTLWGFRRENRIPTTCWWLQPTQRPLSWYVRREDGVMNCLGSELMLLITCHLPAPHPGLVLLEEVPGDADQKLEWAVPTPSP